MKNSKFFVDMVFALFRAGNNTPLMMLGKKSSYATEVVEHLKAVPNFVG